MSAEKYQDSLDVAPEVAYELFWERMLERLRQEKDAGILRLVEDQQQEPAA